MMEAKFLDYMNTLKADSLYNYFNFGAYVGWLSEKKQGIELLQIAIKNFNDEIKGQIIHKASIGYEPMIHGNDLEFKLHRIYNRLKSSEQGIEYLKENRSLINLNSKKILQLKEDRTLFSILSSMGERIISPLARKKELKERGYTHPVHPNFIRAVSDYKESFFANKSEEIKDFYKINPLPRRLIKKAKKVIDLYYEKNKRTNIKLWIKMKERWSDISMNVFKHFLEGYVQPFLFKKELI